MPEPLLISHEAFGSDIACVRDDNLYRNLPDICLLRAPAGGERA